MGFLDGISDELETPHVNHSSSFDIPPSTLPPEPPRSFLYRNAHKSPKNNNQVKLIDFESTPTTQEAQFEPAVYDVPSILHNSNQVK